MALNFGLMGDAAAPVTGYIQGQQEAQRNQLVQQQLKTGEIQQQKAQLELNDFQRRQDGLTKFLAKAQELGHSGDPMELTQAYWEHAIASGDPREIMAAKIAVQAATERQQYMAGQNKPAAAATARPAYAPGALGSGTFDPTAPANALATAAPASVPTNALAAPSQLQQIESRMAELRRYPNVPEAKQELDKLYALQEKLMTPHTVAAGGSVWVPGQGFSQAPEKTPTTPEVAAMQTLGYPLTTEGYKAYRDAQRQERLLTPEEEAQKTRIALASRPPAQPRPEQPPVAVVDPTTGKQVLVSREEALKGRMTPANAMEGLAPKEIQQREAKYPQATAAIKTFEAKSDTLAADMEKLANHPGLSGISGVVYGRTPAVTAAARQAEALYNSIVARGGFAELQNMRASSPTGGALGNVSNQEGQYLRDAFAPINRTQSTPDLKTALISAANATRTAKQRVRDAYDMTYDYKTGAKPAAVAPAGGALGAKPTVSNW